MEIRFSNIFVIYFKFAFFFLFFDPQVLKFLMERNSVNALHGHVTIGTLILQVCTVIFVLMNAHAWLKHCYWYLCKKSGVECYEWPWYSLLRFFFSHLSSSEMFEIIGSFQDCAVGLLFALLPVLGGTSGVLQGVVSMAKS